MKSMLGSLMGSLQELNLATLSGAIDVIAVKHADGTLVSTPFHVRFGKLQLIRSNEKVVNLTVNDQEMDLTMKLGRNGEAYFMLPLDESKAALSVLPDLTRIDSVFPEDSAKDEPQPDLLNQNELKKLQGFVDEDDLNELETAVVAGSERGGGDVVVAVAEGEEEEEEEEQEDVEVTKVEWEWGGLPSDVPTHDALLSPQLLKRQSKHGRGWVRSMLSNLWRGRSDSNAPPPSDIDPPVAAIDEAADEEADDEDASQDDVKHVPRSQKKESRVSHTGEEEDDDAEIPSSSSSSSSTTTTTKTSKTTTTTRAAAPSIVSATTHPASIASLGDFSSGEAAAVYPSSAMLPPGTTQLSLCGSMLSLSDAKHNAEVFASHRVSYEQLCGQPGMVSDANLVFAVLDKLYGSKVALPLLLSKVVFDKPFVLNKAQIAGLEHTRVTSVHPSSLSSFSSSSSAAAAAQKLGADDGAKEKEEKENSGWLAWFRSGRKQEEEKQQHGMRRRNSTHTNNKSAPTTPEKQPQQQQQQSTSPSLNSVTPTDQGNFSTDGEMEGEFQDENHVKYKRSLRPTQEMLESLNLKPGKNEVCFTVHSHLQGTQSITGRVFLWTPEQKIVISDVDGTITRSDILGNLLPLVGRDWSHAGVAELFTKIKNNGFEILYLTARGIGQANVTKSFISNLRQGKYKLPDGPVILSSLRLAQSFKVEVIDRRPHEFKILALRNVRLLFSIFGDHGKLLSQRNPFYAGFGNRLSDVLTYRTCGVPTAKIFVINHHGKIGHINTEYMKTYGEMSEISDSMFPPSDAKGNTGHSYNSSKYWRRPIFDVNALEAEQQQLKEQEEAAKKKKNSISSSSSSSSSSSVSAPSSGVSSVSSSSVASASANAANSK